MSTSPQHPVGAHWRRLVVALICLVLGVALAVALSLGSVSAQQFVVRVSLGDTAPLTLTHSSLGVSIVVLLVGLGMAQLAPPGRFTHWIAFSQVSAIVLFLIAQLNGVTELGALVSVYALSVAGSLFLELRARAKPPGRLAYGFGAAVGIVPWGVIALYEVASMVVGSAVGGTAISVTVRVVTLSELLCAAALWVLAYRAGRSAAAPAEVLRWRGELLIEFAMVGLLVVAVALPR